MSSCALLMKKIFTWELPTQQAKGEETFMSKEQSLLQVGLLFFFFLNKSFCGMSQIIQSGRITLQQAGVEQVELWRQIGCMQHMCFLLKDLEKQVLKS